MVMVVVMVMVMATGGGTNPGCAGPAAAPGGAVGPAGRLHCAARVGGARPNSLRGLRPLRSDSGRESEDEARCARRPRRCAAHRTPWDRCGPSAAGIRGRRYGLATMSGLRSVILTPRRAES